ncbi:MAG: metallophosphoesterase [Deltaproteobacteria bacterium]|nr:metallophosphoesterase [Deltaproteobacteria bacterium]
MRICRTRKDSTINATVVGGLGALIALAVFALTCADPTPSPGNGAAAGSGGSGPPPPVFLSEDASVGADTDAGAVADAGPAADAGVGADAGSVADAGAGADAGTGADAGAAIDAGTDVVRFVAMGDTGKGDASQAAVAAAVAAKCALSGCDFVLLLGDNIYPSGCSSVTDPQFQTKFEQPYAAINLPFYVALGNHDYGGDGAGYEFWKGQVEIDYTARSTKWKMPAEYYRFTRGSTEFFALDTNSLLFGRLSQQKTDISAWIPASMATWKIAYGHHPYLSNGPHGNAGRYDRIPLMGQSIKDFMDNRVCGRADVYLSGHDHSRQWIKATCNGTELVVSGAGATTTSLPGSNTTRFQSSTPGFLYIRVDGRTLTAEFVDKDGRVDFTRTLTK